MRRSTCGRRPSAHRRARVFGVLASVMLAFVAAVAAASEVAGADLVVHDAKVAVSDNNDYRFAEAVAIRDGRFTAVGSNEEVLALRRVDTRVIDAGGRTLIPGLNDSHAHVVRGGRFFNLELRWDGIDSLDEALSMIAQQARRTPSGHWVRVIGGWSPYQFEERRMPTPAELTEAAPDTPVFVLMLYSRGFLNRAGVEALGIDESTAAPPGSRYKFTADGGAILWAEPNPTILYQTIGALPGLSKADQLNSTRHFYRELNRFGLTSAIDAGGGGHVFPADYTGSERLARAGEMPLRVSYYLFPQTPGRELQAFQYWHRHNTPGHNAASLEHGYTLEGAGEFLTWNAGDFENFTADRPTVLERPFMRQELYEATRYLAERRWPIRIHATYDQSLQRILDVFEAVDREHPFDGLKCIIDHAETISRASLQRVKALGCGVALQSRMAFAGEFFRERYGENAAGTAPPLRMLVGSGVPVGLGSDATRVASYNPWLTLYWVVSGRSVGHTMLYPQDNRLTRSEALRLHTEGSAWFSGEADVKGRIEAGAYADFALLTEDYFSVAEERIPAIESLLTVVGGRIVHAAGEFAGMAPDLPEIRPGWSPVAHFGGYGGQR